MSLSDAKIRNAKAKAKPYKMSDGEGLFLLVKSAGKYWRLKYFFAAKEKLLAIGIYPEVSLADARARRAEAHKILAAGQDPGEAKRDAKRQVLLAAENAFTTIALEWYEKRKHKWAANTARINLSRLEQHVFPRVGKRPISKIEAADWLAVFQEIENGGTIYTARRVKQVVSKIYSFAVASSRAKYNPVVGLEEALATPKSKHRAFLKAEELPKFYRNLEKADLAPLTKCALRLIILTLLRTTELRAGEWSEPNIKKAQWLIPPERMKMKKPHIVPLSRQAVAVLKDLEKLSGGHKYIFPNEHNDVKFMSENTMLYALYRMGYRSRATVHGFRSTASTILNEHGFKSDVIERQLAHDEPNKVRAAYNHAEYLQERAEMMQWWADYLDEAMAKGSQLD